MASLFNFLKTFAIRKRKMRILARGEVSGHAHVLVKGKFISRKGKSYVRSTRRRPAVIRHLHEQAYVLTGQEIATGEHGDIVLLPGKYEVVQQLEYDPVTGINRWVWD
ncbi:hypothetical protein [Thermoflavifilum thermophilum]|uniref:Uncharacterized protein n=1 Tax=Thermoflavifilum thermophilum TaxID=1393122 RepID=A0A1I7MXK6_9BACT|nr:hypothetical protein [Thermoflavifilum thermophilum]SFV27110.1 hypothetical protein SAMN05660895_0038 [Thermoflavifilum thermophilum]